MSNLDIKIKKKIFLLNQQGKKKENLIFKNLILSIKDRQFVSVFGPSGCGKSTLLNMISGLDKNYDGSVKIENNKKTSEKNISYMFQTPRLFPWLTAIENIKKTV